MKKCILLLCLCLLLTGCSTTGGDSISQMNGSASRLASADVSEKEPDDTSCDDANQAGKDLTSNPLLDESEVEPEKPEKPSKPDMKQSMPDDELENLDNTKSGYGQGLSVDDKNRPYGALDFNNKYEKYDGYAIENTDKKEICLTFDQGYENGYTANILDVLKEKNVKATFFLLTDYVNKNPELIKRMIDEGHTLGNHSLHHYSMPTLDVATQKEEINSLHRLMIERYNYDMFLFRPPMGEFSEQSVATAQSCGYKTILWSYAYADWDVNRQMSPETAFTKLTKAAHPGAIYLLHSVSKTNSQILGQVIDELIAEGYTFTTPQ